MFPPPQLPYTVMPSVPSQWPTHLPSSCVSGTLCCSLCTGHNSTWHCSWLQWQQQTQWRDDSICIICLEMFLHSVGRQIQLQDCLRILICSKLPLPGCCVMTLTVFNMNPSSHLLGVSTLLFSHRTWFFPGWPGCLCLVFVSAEVPRKIWLLKSPFLFFLSKIHIYFSEETPVYSWASNLQGKQVFFSCLSHKLTILVAIVLEKLPSTLASMASTTFGM